MESMERLISKVKKTILLIISTYSIGFSQLNNNAFNYRYQLDSTTTSKIFLSVNQFSFMKDNEYFSNLVDGYTLFGYQLNPSLIYFPHEHVRLDVGIFLWKDFGNSQYSSVAPTFTFTYSKNDRFRFLFGNIENTLSHGLIEPLFDFERVMNNRLENGLQFIFNQKKFYIDTWVDWQKMIYKNSPFQEEISIGLSSYLKINSDSTHSFKIPFQLTMKHRGGQIVNPPTPNLTNWINGCIGIEKKIIVSNPHIKKLNLQAYITYFIDNSTKKILPFQNGLGGYANISSENKLFYWMLSFWYGYHFFSPQGGPLYASVAVDFLDNRYIESYRRILILRIMRDFKISNELTITTRLEPFFNFNKQHLDFAIGVYINYQDSFLLKKLK